MRLTQACFAKRFADVMALSPKKAVGLAKEVGVGPSTVSRWLRKDYNQGRPPRAAHQEAICRAYGLPPKAFELPVDQWEIALKALKPAGSGVNVERGVVGDTPIPEGASRSARADAAYDEFLAIMRTGVPVSNEMGAIVWRLYQMARGEVVADPSADTVAAAQRAADELDAESRSSGEFGAGH